MPLSVRPEPIRTASEAAPRLVWPNSCPEPSNTRSGSPLATLTIGETSHPPITRLSHPVWACRDRKSTRLNSSHAYISYAVFCLKKKITSPVLICAFTFLIVIVSVFLAYNTNKVLPFVPNYYLSDQLPHGSKHVSSKEVRVVWFR